jgi:hypothetical protein
MMAANSLSYITLYYKGCSGISHKQCDLDGELAPNCLLFLELQFAVGYALVNVVVCIAFSSEWMTSVKAHQTVSSY